MNRCDWNNKEMEKEQTQTCRKSGIGWTELSVGAHTTHQRSACLLHMIEWTGRVILYR